MYGLGISEIAVIFLVLLLFFRPEEIFSFLRKTGQWYSRVNRVQKDMEGLINKGLSDPEGKEAFGFDTDQKGKNKRSDISKAVQKDPGEEPYDFEEAQKGLSDRQYNFGDSSKDIAVNLENEGLDPKYKDSESDDYKKIYRNEFSEDFDDDEN